MVPAGNSADETICAAENEHVELIVIATHGLTGWRRFVFSSAAERVVRISTCPVLTIPAPGKEKET